jgi:hypothetical protein
VDDLSALVGDVLLCGLELLLGSVLLESDLEPVSMPPSQLYIRTYIELSHLGDCGGLPVCLEG